MVSAAWRSLPVDVMHFIEEMIESSFICNVEYYAENKGSGYQNTSKGTKLADVKYVYVWVVHYKIVLTHLLQLSKNLRSKATSA